MNEVQANVLMAQGYNLQVDAKKLEAKGQWQSAAKIWEKSASLLASAATQTGDPDAKNVLKVDANEAHKKARAAAAKPDEKKSPFFMKWLKSLFGSRSNLDECKRIIADLERQGMDLSTYKKLLETAEERGDQNVIDSVLQRLKNTTFVR